MITDSSSRSVMADTQVIVRRQAEGTVPGSPAGSGIMPGPEGGWSPVAGTGSARGRPGGRTGPATLAGIAVTGVRAAVLC